MDFYHMNTTEMPYTRPVETEDLDTKSLKMENLETNFEAEEAVTETNPDSSINNSTGMCDNARATKSYKSFKNEIELDNATTEEEEQHLANFNGHEDEKPCIVALRAAVEAYERRRQLSSCGSEDVQLEKEKSRLQHKSGSPINGLVHQENEPTVCDETWDPEESGTDFECCQIKLETEENAYDMQPSEHGLYPHLQPSICQKPTEQDHREEFLKNVDNTHDCFPAGKLETYPYKCDLCDKVFKWKSGLNRHKLMHSGETPYKCDVCGKGFIQKWSLDNHKLIHSDKVPYKCDVCDRGFKWKSSLDGHKLIHSGETRYKCDVCDRRFRWKGGLDRHKLIHSGETPYKCDVCDRGFRWKSNLVGHKLIHSGETPYKCDMCDRGFRWKNDLVKHKLIHSGETPYKCDVCDRGFRWKSDLDRHNLIHSGETPYKCDMCDRGFRWKRDLVSHKLIHSGETRYKCDVCGRGFRCKGGLDRHKLIHSGEAPYKCDVCDRGFRCKSNLISHKLIHSGETHIQVYCVW